MALAGWPTVLDVDFSPTAVAQNCEALERARRDAEAAGESSVLEALRGLVFLEADARTMRPASLSSHVAGPADGVPANGVPAERSARFGVCVDKGLVDGLWCGGVEASRDIPLVSRSVASLLAPGGRFLVISYSGPDALEPLLTGHPGVTLKSGALGLLWNRLETRKLESIYLHVLERSSRQFSEVDSRAIFFGAGPQESDSAQHSTQHSAQPGGSAHNGEVENPHRTQRLRNRRKATNKRK
mmetsp:Transcript_20419/g.46141  ORF Transcript_20419/g.46141 Transcript_20419/m.46141 type:complete len:242 (+) Transcript_20419:246-971(+)